MLVLPESEFRTELFIETRFLPSLCHDQLTAQYSCSSTAVAYNRSRKSLFAAPPYTPSAARRCCCDRAAAAAAAATDRCAALKVLAAGNSFQDVATFSGMSVTTAETSFHHFCKKFSSPHNERATKVILTKVPDQKFPKNFYFSRNFMLP